MLLVLPEESCCAAHCFAVHLRSIMKSVFYCVCIRIHYNPVAASAYRLPKRQQIMIEIKE